VPTPASTSSGYQSMAAEIFDVPKGLMSGTLSLPAHVRCVNNDPEYPWKRDGRNAAIGGLGRWSTWYKVPGLLFTWRTKDGMPGGNESERHGIFLHQKSVTIPKKNPCSSRHLYGARALKCGRVSTFAPNTWDPALGHVTGFAERSAI